MNKEQFIAKIGPLAKKEEQQSGILASLTIAQAILESGWGNSGLTVKGNALFGIKAGSNWSGKVYNAKTQECYDGKNFETITAGFRAYNTWEESIKDHSRLLTSLTRYKKVVGEKDYKKACREIQAAGYATDPNYANKLIGIIEENNLNQWNAAETAARTGVSGKMNVNTFISKLYDIKRNYRTIYAWGCFGGIMTNSMVENKARQYPSMYDSATKAAMKRAGSQGAFGFDCVNLIKGILWGWNGSRNATWGGAVYASNGVPDVSADGMINKCIGVSSNFSNIQPGEAVWLPGHIGVYVGNGRVIECTPKWSNGVQETALLNHGPIAGLNGRRWSRHGKIPYINYNGAVAPQPQRPSSGSKKTVGEIAKEVIAGAWGVGNDRKSKLEAAGYNYNQVQAEVNNILSGRKPSAPKKTVAEVAKEVIAGAWGNGNDRINKLKAAGYNYNEVQAEVNRQLSGGGSGRKSVTEVAKEVIAGKWGNGNERRKKLQDAGYNYNQVQAEVNRLL